MSSADRQRRLRERRRLHAAGDHSMCIAGRCDARPAGPDLGVGDIREVVTGDVTPVPRNSVSQPAPPAGLLERGTRLWQEMAGLKLAPTHVLLLERACRMADRQALIDEQLAEAGGEGWLTLAKEARQHDIALKNLVSELRHAGRPAAGTAKPGRDVKEPEGPEEVGEGAKRGGLAAIRGGLDAARG